MSVRLRCSSWSQLVSIYRRDISRGQLFLRSDRSPAPGTALRIHLVLPSGGSIEVRGLVSRVLVGDEPQEEEGGRGAGALVGLEPLSPASKLSLENAVKAATAQEARAQASLDPAPNASPPPSASPKTSSPPPTKAPIAGSDTLSFDRGLEVTAAEDALVNSLRNELSTLAKLNAFQVLGVGYGADDDDVRGAFGELSKRYHPDRFVRYQSADVSVLAEELYIRARAAYKQTSTGADRAALAAQIKLERRPRKQPPPELLRLTGRSRSASQTARQRSIISPRPRPPTPKPIPVPSSMSGTAETALSNSGKLPKLIPARNDAATPAEPTRLGSNKLTSDRELSRSGPLPIPTADKLDPLVAFPDAKPLIERNRYTDAAGLFNLASRRDRENSAAQAGVELAEGLRALAAGDRLEAAQRFEAVLDLHPANEVAAQELAKMRRHSSNQRQGLLAQLMKDQGL